ncbi:glycosyltransferase [Patulibacter defluvii]|uniref:glycosyltransferase n=1 Tax=Patulibacter defluvii TaxID=3095358 RepID=UPI002A752260|nr:glycosyltransferase [Patulibacter sp. DM4]
MRVAYVVSRFPQISETFIVRELDEVAAAGVAIELFSLFGVPDGAVAHPRAAPWVARLHRGRPVRGLAALGWWGLRRPLRLGGSLAAIAWGHRRSPRHLLRALATAVLAADHARTMQRLGVARVHAHYATYPALTAWLVRRLTGLPYGFTAHAHDLYVDRSFLRRKVEDADLVVTISRFNQRLLRQVAPAARRIEVVHMGVDPTAYAFRPRTLPATGPVRLLCVASLQEYKGHAVLLAALDGRPELARIELDLVGDGPLRATLEADAAARGLAARVRFHGGQPEQRVRELLEAADGFVLPSVVARDGQMEGLPVALMEALAVGLPTVTTRLSGIPELVVDGETGLLAEPADPRALGDALARLLADPAAARTRAAAGRRHVEAAFDLRTVGATMAALVVDPDAPLAQPEGVAS